MTKYGEFVCSAFHWLPIDEQKKKAKKMADMTNSMRREMLKKVQEADFMALEWQLYLNTHPNCERGLRHYIKAVEEAKMLRKEYEENFGPLTASASRDKLPWQWSKNPWVWEKERS